MKKETFISKLTNIENNTFFFNSLMQLAFLTCFPSFFFQHSTDVPKELTKLRLRSLLWKKQNKNKDSYNCSDYGAMFILIHSKLLSQMHKNWRGTTVEENKAGT